ncbi:ATP12 family chaperone protein [Rhodovulum sulfidophilum]|uniref:ATPase n=1 Tax=Rhodovulum sulfidophilum TaxID=35806 RepID=A0ABS1RXG5_RHOSU|nr:ATP12 family protein [Rhodovulum sulfidophilum]MBL3560039.1 ATPase [Rhodovulum sulfidophilum]MBL3610784.1 ATPase [Rhodovulum sulfidophilum]MCE8457365.1 ATPase [Rhodovulum sulfidophilum]OLS53730.1 ATPase [Rhodovulum sulfidophilum]
MSEWALKRFWTEAGVAPAEDGFAVLLDGRPVKTPAKRPLAVPTRAMAEAVAAEWDAQEDQVAPLSMPVTRAANAAIDKVMEQRAEVAELIAAYGESDLLCHRAESPAELVRRQAESWDPLLAWAASTLGAPLEPTPGVIPRPQPSESLSRLRSRVAGLDAFELTALHDLVGLSGSLVIGLAAAEGLEPPERLWELSRIDETWQQEQWGLDDEAAEVAAARQRDFLQARRFLDLARASL